MTVDFVSSFSRAPGAVWTQATRRKAPHKPLLLLAVLDLVQRGVITTPFIAVSADLVELNETGTPLNPPLFIGGKRTREQGGAARRAAGADQQYRRIS